MIKVIIVTWNVGESVVEMGLGDEKLKEMMRYEEKGDIYVIGLQEIEMKPVSFVRPCQKGLKWKKWNDVIKKVFGSGDEVYRIVKSERYGGLYSCIVVKEKVLMLVNDVEVDRISCGLLNVIANKGAIGIRMNICETSLCFLNVHMLHGQKKIKERNENYKRIKRSINFGLDDEFFNMENHDVLFYYGDINYRLNLTYDGVVRLLEQPDRLMKKDQLYDQIEKRTVFQNYKEHEIKFQPTYKYKKRKKQKNVERVALSPSISYVYDTKRVPSYPDRILWKVNSDNYNVKCTEYNSYRSFYCSDHQPVVGVYEINVKAKNTQLYEKLSEKVILEYEDLVYHHKTPLEQI